MKNLSILGSTGSIGCSTLELVAAHPDKFHVTALTAGVNLELLARQIEVFRPRLVSVLNAELAGKLSRMLCGYHPDIIHGVPGLIAAATASDVDMVVAAIVGAAGLVPTAAAIIAGKDVALANKETLVVAGELVTKRDNASRKSELVIFLRPVVVQEASLHGDYAHLRQLLPGQAFFEQPAEAIPLNLPGARFSAQ